MTDTQTWQAALDNLPVREKAAARELDAIAAQRRRMPMAGFPDYTLIGPDGPIRLVDVFGGRKQMTNPVVDLVGDRTGRIVGTVTGVEGEGPRTVARIRFGVGEKRLLVRMAPMEKIS